MLILPPIEELAEKMGNKFRLCNVVGKRAKQIQKEHIEKQERATVKEISQAAQEVYEDKIIVED